MTETELEVTFWGTCSLVGISSTNQNHLRSILAPLREKSNITRFHYDHSLRVGMLAMQIGQFIHHEPKPLLFAGALHDLGKCQTCLDVLGKTGSWTVVDQEEMRSHVIDGYRLLRGRFDLTAEAMLWHHKFQEDSYPETLPPFLHDYQETTKLLIREYGRIVAIADVFDALHRVNEKSGEAKALTNLEIRQKMDEYNPDRKRLVAALYSAGILQ